MIINGRIEVITEAILPVNPGTALVVYRKDIVDIAPLQASEADARALNTYQVNLCIRELYSAQDLSAEVDRRVR